MSKVKVRLIEELPKGAGIPCIGRFVLYADRVVTVDDQDPIVKRDLNHYKDLIEVFPESEDVVAYRDIQKPNLKKNFKVSKASKAKKEKVSEPENDGGSDQEDSGTKPMESMTQDPANTVDLTQQLRDSIKVKGGKKK